MYRRISNTRTLLRTRALAALAVGALAIPAAEAIPLTDSDSFTNVLTELVNQPLRVDLFDPMLGTLNSVSVELSASLTSSGSVENTAAQAQNFSVSTLASQYDGTAVGAAALPTTFTVFSFPDLIAQESYSGLAPLTPAPFGPGTLDTGGFVSVLSSTDPGVLSQFSIGPGQFGYDFNTLISTLTTGGGGNVDTTIDTLTSATLRVTYDFTPPVQVVPEPATLALLGLGLAGLGFARRRRSTV